MLFENCLKSVDLRYNWVVMSCVLCIFIIVLVFFTNMVKNVEQEREASFEMISAGLESFFSSRTEGLDLILPCVQSI